MSAGQSRTIPADVALGSLVSRLVDTERFRDFAGDGAAARARVSEPLLPLVVAALFMVRSGPLVVLVPDDAEARDLAEAAGWFVGPEAVGLFASRGVRVDSGLESPAHLVGERARALDVLGKSGLVCASAVGLGEALPPARLRPEPIELRAGAELSVDAVAEALALAGYQRVERVEARGDFAVRGGLIDVFTPGAEAPLRLDLFGDTLESIRRFDPLSQRTS
ncbi:MAG: transcription-repair coupling factor, partial [Gaiellales bacterium]